MADQLTSRAPTELAAAEWRAAMLLVCLDPVESALRADHSAPRPPLVHHKAVFAAPASDD